MYSGGKLNKCKQWDCLEQVDSESVWKRTVGKIKTNGMIHYFEKAILEGIWKRKVD